MRAPLLLSSIAGLLLFCACGASDGDGAAPPGGDPSGSSGGTSDGGPESSSGGDGGPGAIACTDGEATCTGFDRRRLCKSEGGSTRFVEETCAAGSGCFKGACVPARCSDECTLGKADGARTCASWDMKSGTWSTNEPTKSLHDRAREYTRWVQKDHLPFGGLADVQFSDASLGTHVRHDTGDSALWTGTYLATEAWRLLATGSLDARAHVRDLVKTLHLWFNISPSPGVLVRFVQPAGANSPSNGIDCAKNTHHCGVSYEGKSYDYNGHVSRDQYQGVMLGYALAYEALGSEDEVIRALIRDDVLRFIDELMLEREVDAKLLYQGTTIPVKLKTRFMVVVQEELDAGKIVLSYDGNEKGGWVGFQEFLPNLADIFKQIPLIGAIAPSVIPRDGSAIMLASFFDIALRVTEGIPAQAAKRAAIQSFYLTNTGRGGNVHDWIAIANGWTRGGDDCGNQYYSNNISMQPLYNWARLEKDPGVRASALDLVKNKAWPAWVGQKNTFFTFLTGANVPSPDAAVLGAAKDQLAQFAPTRVMHPAIDLRTDGRFMPHQSSCPEKAGVGSAVDIKERPNDGFVWQRDPWSLHQDADPALAHAGVDYLSAYWLGRRHDFVADDAESRCLRWK